MSSRVVHIDVDDWPTIVNLSQALGSALGIAPGTDISGQHKALHKALQTLLPPDEPKQLGAVVVDVHGRFWVRYKTAERQPWRVNLPGEPRPELTANWDGIRVKRVLSPGAVT